MDSGQAVMAACPFLVFILNLQWQVMLQAGLQTSFFNFKCSTKR